MNLAGKFADIVESLKSMLIPVPDFDKVISIRLLDFLTSTDLFTTLESCDWLSCAGDSKREGSEKVRCNAGTLGLSVFDERFLCLSSVK